MKIYQNLGGNSSIVGYEYDSYSITIWFARAKRTYTYSYASAGASNVEMMKRLADQGYGLCSFINHNVYGSYVK